MTAQVLVVVHKGVAHVYCLDRKADVRIVDLDDEETLFLPDEGDFPVLAKLAELRPGVDYILEAADA